MINSIHILHEDTGTLFTKNYGERNLCFELFTNFLTEVASDRNEKVGYIHFNDFIICYITHKPILIAVMSSNISQHCNEDFIQEIYERFVSKYRDYLNFSIISQKQVFSDFETDLSEVVGRMRFPLQII